MFSVYLKKFHNKVMEKLFWRNVSWEKFKANIGTCNIFEITLVQLKQYYC